MIDVSDEIKQAYDLSTTQIDKIILDGQEYRITNVQYYDDVYEEGNIFGTAIARGLEFEIENAVDLEKKEVEYLTGIQVNGITNWISIGNFIVQDVEPNDTTNIAKITAMDYMIKTNITYETSLNYLDGTVTILDVLQEACTNSGIELATTDFANKDFIVDSNQFAEKSLNRQVIQAVAQISGTVAKIRRDNKLYLINLDSRKYKKALTVKEVNSVSVKEVNTTNVKFLGTTVGFPTKKVFTLNNYKEAEIKRATHQINVVSLGMSDVEGENITLRDEESIEKNGENILVINDNPFAYTQAKRELLIEALFNVVKGFEYKAYSFTCQGLPFLETLDKIEFIDKEGNTYDSFVFRFNYKSPDGLESTIEAPSITKATVNYQNVPSALEIAKKTELKVNKQEQTIQGIIQEQEGVNNKMTQQTQDINSITSTVSETKEVVEQLDENTVKTDEYNTYVQTVQSTFEQLNNQIEFRFVNAIDRAEAIEEVVNENQSVLEEYIRFSGALIELGRVGNDFTAELSNTQLAFKQNGTAIAYISNNKLYITDAEVKNKLTIGKFAFIPRSNGNLSFKWIGG